MAGPCLLNHSPITPTVLHVYSRRITASQLTFLRKIWPMHVDRVDVIRRLQNRPMIGIDAALFLTCPKIGDGGIVLPALLVFGNDRADLKWSTQDVAILTCATSCDPSAYANFA